VVKRGEGVAEFSIGHVTWNHGKSHVWQLSQDSQLARHPSFTPPKPTQNSEPRAINNCLIVVVQPHNIPTRQHHEANPSFWPRASAHPGQVRSFSTYLPVTPPPSLLSTPSKCHKLPITLISTSSSSSNMADVRVST